MPRVLALIVTDLEKTRLGLPSRTGQHFGDATVLQHTVSQIDRVKAINAIVLVHPQGQDPRPLLEGGQFRKPIETHADPTGLTDIHHPQRRAARAWSLTSWRGGLGGATCYDELLPAHSLHDAMQRHSGDSALIVGADWPLVDPDYCQIVLEVHLENPEAMAFTFTQAPPGLVGAAASRNLIKELVDKRGTFGQLLDYNPTSPQADPIGHDVCVQIDADVRSCARRFIYDTDRSAAMIDAVAHRLSDGLSVADAPAIVNVAGALEHDDFENLPQQVTVELTPKRVANGSIVPQHYVKFDRAPMPLDAALSIVEQLGASGDTALTLGGLGDAMLYDQWPRVVDAAVSAGVLSINIQTDLLVDRAAVQQLAESPVDVVSVRLNADTEKLYHEIMGLDRFGEVVGHLEFLLNHRRGGSNGNTTDRAGLPWVVPHMVKTQRTLDEMESFFDRWTYFGGAGVIEPAMTGCGLMPDLAPMNMASPKRRPCLQIERRLTIHSDGTAAQCDQDWLGRAGAGGAHATRLADIWHCMKSMRAAHRKNKWQQIELCRNCNEWHRP